MLKSISMEKTSAGLRTLSKKLGGLPLTIQNLFWKQLVPMTTLLRIHTATHVLPGMTLTRMHVDLGIQIHLSLQKDAALAEMKEVSE
jgi:hypothetical protein